MTGSALLLIMGVSDGWSIIALKSTLFNRWEIFAMPMVNPHSSNSIIEYFWQHLVIFYWHKLLIWATILYLI